MNTIELLTLNTLQHCIGHYVPNQIEINIINTPFNTIYNFHMVFQNLEPFIS